MAGPTLGDTVMWRAALVGVAVLFLAFLLVKMRPVRHRRAALSAEVRAARDRAHAATTPRARAEALCEAAALAASGVRGTAAAGFYLRAMNSDPTWPVPVKQATAAFHKRRPVLLENMLWRRLAHLPWDDAHRAVLRAAAEGLTHLHTHELKDATKADMFRQLAKTFEERA